MKTTFLLCCALAPSAFAGPPILARITPQALAKLQQSSPMVALHKPTPAQASVNRPEDQSIIKQSMILTDGKNWTLVPKGAVLFLPEAMRSRVNVKPTGTLLAWSEFLAKNYAWITTNDVSFDQAAGTKPLPAERVMFWGMQDKVVVAVHQNGPISVRVPTENPTLTQR